MRDNTVHVRRGKKHPSRMEMIVLAALAALMVSGGTLLLLAALLDRILQTGTTGQQLQQDFLLPELCGDG